MKWGLMNKVFLAVSILLAASTFSVAQNCQYSPLWGQQGELWDPNGKLKDFSFVGYHQGDDPVPYQQRAASMTFGPGRHTITTPILITDGVLRGAGKDETILFFPERASSAWGL